MILNSVSRALCKTSKIFFNKNFLLTLGYDSYNWGDALNPVLIQEISGKTPLIVTKYTYNIYNATVYSVIGSVLEIANKINCRNNNLVIWGTGFISNQGRLKIQPKKICAVRGPLSREILLKQGYICPEIYGDPALLYPRYYKPNVQKKYKLGIIPHYIDRGHEFLNNIQNNPDILIIDILGGLHNVVDRICSCQKIASSSLHGIIAADAYGIPSTWLKLSDKITGGSFKYLDYFMSVGRTEDPLVIREDSSIDDILDAFTKYKLDININELWEACPFKRN